MKICKVAIIKRLEGLECKYIYPADYNPYKITIISYDELPVLPGDNQRSCIGKVDNNFTFTNKMQEISKTEAINFINQAALNIEGEENKARFIETRKKLIEG